MGSSIQPQNDPVASYLATYGTGGASAPPPVQAESTHTASAHDPVASYLAKYGTGTPRAAAETPDDIANTPLRWLNKAAETVSSGLPGGRGLVALGTGLSDLLTGQGVDASLADANHSLDRQQRDVASVPRVLRVPLQILGSAPLAAATAPLGLLGGGAAFGGAAGADKPISGDPLSEANLRARLLNTAGSAALGAAGAKAGQLLGKGISNLGARSGATDAIANLVRKVSPETAEAMGTAGQVNSALSTRQDLLDNLGDVGDTGQSAAQQQIAREAGTQAQAKVLYNAARKDVQPLDDPELNALLSDPAVQKQYQNVVRVRNAGSNPLPTSTSPENVPSGLAKQFGMSQETYARLQALAQSRSRIPALSGTDILPPELSGEPSGVSLPDPEALATLRKELYNTARGFQNSNSGLKQEEALDLLDKVDKITQKLYAASPSRQTANQFYAGAKGEEEGFGQGFDAFTKARNLTGETLTENSPEAQQLALDTPRYRGEPPAAQQARGEAFRLGASGAARQAILNKPVDRGLQSILGIPELAPTQPAMQARSLMFANPADASFLEQTLARVRGEAAALPSTSGAGRVATSLSGAMRNVVRKAIHAPDLLDTPTGQSLLTQLLGDPSALAGSIGNFRQGDAALSALAQGLGISLGGQAAR